MWLVIALLFVSIVASLISLVKKGDTASDYYGILFNITKWFIYLQALLGITLLFISPLVKYESGFMKSSLLRYYGMEHPLMMLIAIGFVAIGLYKSKKKDSIIKKNRTILITYSIALIIMLVMIPWNAVMS